MCPCRRRGSLHPASGSMHSLPQWCRQERSVGRGNRIDGALLKVLEALRSRTGESYRCSGRRATTDRSTAPSRAGSCALDRGRLGRQVLTTFNFCRNVCRDGKACSFSGSAPARDRTAPIFDDPEPGTASMTAALFVMRDHIAHISFRRENFSVRRPWPSSQQRLLQVHATSANAGKRGPGACKSAQTHEGSE